jgi:ubiquinone/menaquinone biosynthesis C-methylase UbiE
LRKKHLAQSVDQPARSHAVNGQVSEHQFVDVAPLYDLLMTGVPYHDWVAYLNQLLTSRKAHPERVLDLACGTGNVSEILAKEGFHVTGVDIAPGMITEAKRKAQLSGLNIDYYVQDAAELDLPGRQFDLCVSLFDSLNYIIDPLRLELAMKRVAHHMETGALFIFDLNSEFALKNKFFDQDNLSHPEERLQYDWNSSYDDKSRICRVDMQFSYREDDGTKRPFEEVHLQYAYRTDEILQMLTDAGFEDISTYQAYTLRMPTRTADRVYYVARRI